MGNLGTGFLRKVSKSEEGLTRILRINVGKTGWKGYQKRLRDILKMLAKLTRQKRFSSYEATSTFMRLT